MTYREAIKNSLDTVEIKDCTVSDEKQKMEIQKREILPLVFPSLLFSMAGILTVSAEQLCTTMPSYSLNVKKSSSVFPQKETGQVLISDVLQVFVGNDLMRYGNLSVHLGQFLTWLLDKEIPETDDEVLWYDIQSLGKYWNEFALMKMNETE